MKIAPEISYRGIRKTDALDRLIHEKIGKIERFYHQISSCRVAVEKVHDHPDSGSPYKVRLDITVPESREIVVNQSPKMGEPHTPLEAVIRDAFETAGRQLKSMNEQQHNPMKAQAAAKREVILDDDGVEDAVVPAADLASR
ncbi:MAG: HPF/RaiA family ribosome-associated protein [Phormidesmis sp.]